MTCLNSYFSTILEINVDIFRSVSIWTYIHKITEAKWSSIVVRSHESAVGTCVLFQWISIWKDPKVPHLHSCVRKKMKTLGVPLILPFHSPQQSLEQRKISGSLLFRVWTSHVLGTQGQASSPRRKALLWTGAGNHGLLSFCSGFQHCLES